MSTLTQFGHIDKGCFPSRQHGILFYPRAVPLELSGIQLIQFQKQCWNAPDIGYIHSFGEIAKCPHAEQILVAAALLGKFEVVKNTPYFCGIWTNDEMGFGYRQSTTIYEPMCRNIVWTLKNYIEAVKAKTQTLIFELNLHINTDQRSYINQSIGHKQILSIWQKAIGDMQYELLVRQNRDSSFLDPEYCLSIAESVLHSLNANTLGVDFEKNAHFLDLIFPPSLCNICSL